MNLSFTVQRAARLLRDGGVIAYPTEGVYGLGCLPGDEQAVDRVLAIKKRGRGAGLVLIAADNAQLRDWIDTPNGIPEPDIARPISWVVPAAASVPDWIRGRHSGVAVRITTHPVAAALCNAAGSALVSTSANISGHRPARNLHVLRRSFSALVDSIVPGPCGPARGPSEIRDLASGAILRPAG